MSKRLGNGFMDYMETAEAPYLVVETRAGTFFVPGDLCGTGPDVTPADVRDYVEGEPESVETVRTGVLWRMTAPGYMDSTDWTPADDEAAAERDALETYGDTIESDDDESDDA